MAAVCLTHWGRVTYICVSNLIIIGSDNGLSPGRRQAIIWTNAGILLTRPLGTIFNEILIEVHTFSFKKMVFKLSSGKWRPFCLGLNVLNEPLWPACIWAGRPWLHVSLYNLHHLASEPISKINWWYLFGVDSFHRVCVIVRSLSHCNSRRNTADCTSWSNRYINHGLCISIYITSLAMYIFHCIVIFLVLNYIRSMISKAFMITKLQLWQSSGYLRASETRQILVTVFAPTFCNVSNQFLDKCVIWHVVNCTRTLVHHNFFWVSWHTNRKALTIDCGTHCTIVFSTKANNNWRLEPFIHVNVPRDLYVPLGRHCDRPVALNVWRLRHFFHFLQMVLGMCKIFYLRNSKSILCHA